MVIRYTLGCHSSRDSTGKWRFRSGSPIFKIPEWLVVIIYFSDVSRWHGSPKTGQGTIFGSSLCLGPSVASESKRSMEPRSGKVETLPYYKVWLSWMKPYYEIRCWCFFIRSQIGFTWFFSKALKSGCRKQPLDPEITESWSESKPGGKGQTLPVWSRQRIHKSYSRTVFTLRAFTGINQPKKIIAKVWLVRLVVMDSLKIWSMLEKKPPKKHLEERIFGS